jgi:ribosomal protein L7/L12
MPHFISNETFYKITEALRLGNRLEAIKLYKNAANCSFLDAKIAIDKWATQKPLITECDNLTKEKPSADSLDKIFTFLMEGKRFMAFEYIREVYELEAAEANEYLENLEKGKMSTAEMQTQKKEVSEAEIKAKMSELLRSNQKLLAVKELRILRNFTLLEAIAYINTLEKEVDSSPEEPPPNAQQNNYSAPKSPNEEDTDDRVEKMILWGMVAILMYIFWWIWA